MQLQCPMVTAKFKSLVLKYMKTMFSFRPVEIWTSSIWINEIAVDLPQGKWEQKTILPGFFFISFLFFLKKNQG